MRVRLRRKARRKTMLDFLKRLSVKEGLSPGSLVYSGVSREFTPSICLHAYTRDSLREYCVAPDAPIPEIGAEETSFLSLTGVHDADFIKRVGQWAGVHALALEDAMNTGQQTKLDWFDNALFVVLKVLIPGESGPGTTEHLALFLGQERVVAFQEGEDDTWTHVLRRLRTPGSRIRRYGAAYLFIALMDSVIDRHYAALGRINANAERIESELADRVTEAALTNLYHARREVILLGNVFTATRAVLDELARADTDLFPEDVLPYLMDVRDHARQVAEAAQTLQSLLTGMIELQISLAGMRMNNVMKVLTLVATIFIPLTFLAGIYGMNFEHMPELRWEYGYPALIALMAAIAVGLAAIFRIRRWF